VLTNHVHRCVFNRLVNSPESRTMLGGQVSEVMVSNLVGILRVGVQHRQIVRHSFFLSVCGELIE
jgi:hypothetical protein